MTRHKRKIIKRTLRTCILLLMPVAFTASVHAVKEMREAVDKRTVMSTQENPKSDTSYDSSGESTEIILKMPSTEKIFPDESLVLSHGYGYCEETEDRGELLKLESPLDMTSDNPGEKPYPSKDNWGSGGDIIRTTYEPYKGNAFINLEKGGQVNNKTSVPNETLEKESRYLPNFTISDTSEPQVLIYHTHTTESFEPFVRENFDASFNYRTTDETKNMIMVGNAIEAELEEQGIGVIHVTTIHDYPSYNGSYARSRDSILPVLEKYPSIKVVLDIHRDAISGEGYAYQPYIEIDGKEAAQIMIISGCDDGTLDMPNYMKNFHFACTLQQKLESDYPGFTRPVLFDYRHYNQDLTVGSLLIEVGSHGNTLEQAQYSGQLFGQSLGELLNSMNKRKSH